MKTEADIASYLGTEGCIVYAQAFSTISSVIPAFCKRGDVIITDTAANYSIRKGLEISRSNIRWFNHGDMEDLERQMKKVVEEQVKQKKLTRRFVVTEGLFETTGDCSDLPKLVGLSNQPRLPFLHSSSTRPTNGVPDRSSSGRSTNFASSLTKPGPSASSAAPAVVLRKLKTWILPRWI